MDLKKEIMDDIEKVQLSAEEILRNTIKNRIRGNLRAFGIRLLMQSALFSVSFRFILRRLVF